MHNIHDTSYAREGGAIEGMRAFGILRPIPADDLGPRKVRLVKYHIDWEVFINCVGLCAFMPYSREQVRDLVRAVTGWNSTCFELMKVGERAMAMARVFNYRHGLRARDDVLPERISTAFPSGPIQGVCIPEEVMREAIALYHGMNGWDGVTGAPTRSKLYELGLGWVAEQMESA